MKVKIFRQRITQVHEGEEEVNNWLAENEGSITIADICQSAYMTEGGERGTPGYIISVWYDEKS